MTWTDSILKSKDEGGWNRKITALRSVIRSVGPLWPSSTKLSGYGEKGPYHCGNCKYLVDSNKCEHPVVISDEQVKKDKDGMPLVNAARGCCEFVEPK